MKRFYLQFRVMLITLALGLASVSFINWLNNYSTEIPVDLPEVESGSPILIFPREIGFMPRGGGSGWCGGRREKHQKQKIKDK